MGDLIVRNASAEDISEILAVARECGLENWSAEAYSREIDSGDGCVLVAHHSGGTISGFIVGRSVPGPAEYSCDAEIYNVGVPTVRRRSGVARALLRRFLDICLSRRVTRVWLEVRASNAGALAFYASSGFARSGTRKGFYRNPHEDAIVMSLKLE